MENNTFGETLRQIRQDRGVSQRDLAKQCGVNFTYLSKIENGIMPPPGEKALGKIAALLEADELFYLAGKIPYDLKAMVTDNPKLAELLCHLSKQRLSNETYDAMIALVLFDVMDAKLP